MIARAAGAFILTFIAISYLFEGEADSALLLAALLVSAAVACVVAWWLRPERARHPVEPGVFDERATRSAVRRGIARTALTAVVWVVLGLIVLYGASGAWQSRGDRKDHFGEVGRNGLPVANAGFRVGQISGCCSTSLRSFETRFVFEPRAASALAQPLELPLRLDLRGHLVGGLLSTADLPKTGVDVAESSPRLSVRKLADLPDATVASAVVELRAPATLVDTYRLFARDRVKTSFFGADDALALYLEPADNLQALGRGGEFHRRVSWPSANLAQFQQWVKTLRGSDNGVLRDLQLPDVSTLEQIARKPRVYGFALDRVSPAQLRRLLADGTIESVQIGDVAFNVGRPSA